MAHHGRLAGLAAVFALAAAPMAFAERMPAPAAVTHPLDALTPREIQRAVAVLQHAGRADEHTLFAWIELEEPSKAAVHAWRPGRRITRRAHLSVVRDARVYDAIVNLNTGRVEAWTEAAGAVPRPMDDGWDFNATLATNPDFLAALGRRGITDASSVFCIRLTPGPLNNPAYAGRWVSYAPCYIRHGADELWFGRPVEGLVVVSDVAAHSVLSVVDLGPVAAPIESASLNPDRIPNLRAPAHPIATSAPEGYNFVRQGSRIDWDNWSFHVRSDGRRGVVLSLINFNDGANERAIAYEISAAEMYVPYMNPAPTWSWRSYMDVGEFGFGLNASYLQPGADCPADATFLDVTIANAHGAPMTKSNAICVFEQPTGGPVWRSGLERESRADAELVVRTIPNIGNYDYIIDYVFDRAGNIDVRVGATGIDATMGAAARTLEQARANGEAAYGVLIAPGLVGVNHDHYVSFRVDLDIDGEANRAVLDRFTPQMLPEDSFRRSLWTANTEIIANAGPLREPADAGALRIESASRTNAMGYPTSYQIAPGHMATSLLHPDDPIQHRAAWAGYTSWLSLYDPAQRFPSGDNPNMNASGDGLAQWTAPRQNIDGKDMVLWLTTGFRHIPRAEDWPVMPTVWHNFELRPVNFFDHNPSLNLPRTTAPAPAR